MPHSFLHMYRILPLRKPNSDPPVPEIVLHEVTRKLCPLGCGLERVIQGPDPRSGFVVSP